MEWVQDNWLVISLIAPAVYGLLRAIAKVTKTDVDDKALDLIAKVTKVIISGKKK